MTAMPNVGSLVPPHNFEAEQALIGSILMNNSAHAAVSELVRAEHFSDPLHGKLFAMLGRLIERGQVVSAFTLKSYAESDDDLKRAGGPAYIAKLVASSVHVVNAPAAARTVQSCHVRRLLIDAAQSAMLKAYSENEEATASEQVEALEHRLYELADGADTGGFRSFASCLAEAIKSAEAAHSRPGQLAGISTGLRTLDNRLGGLNRSDVVVLAGRPGMGKTGLGTNIAYAAAKQGPVAFFSLEMSCEQLAARIISEQGGVPAEKVRRGELNSAQMDRVLEVVTAMESLPLYIDDSPGLTLSGLRTRARRVKRQHGLELIVVDYLQLIQTTKNRENRVQEVSEITRGLKTLAKELNVPVLALSQLSRNVEQRQDKRPLLSDLRDSGSIEQDADIVMFIYREEYYRKLANQDASDVAGKAEVNVAKHRHGPTGMVDLKFDGPTTRFTDWASA